jgi:hypothetical protein
VIRIPWQDLDRPHRLTVTVDGLIEEIDPDRENSEGVMHQIFSVTVTAVEDDSEQSGVAKGETVNVAVRYGDPSALPERVPGLAVGQAVTLKGIYIPKSQAYTEEDGDRNAVIHFTHHPVGWIEYQGEQYR